MDEKAILKRVVRCNATTSMANAFRRFFGLPQSWERLKAPAVVSLECYTEVEECFRNHGSPMDGRRWEAAPHGFA